MRIGHYVTDLDGQGGIETYVTRLGEGLAARGYPVTYFGRRGSAAAHRIRVDTPEALYDAARRQNVDVLHLHKAVAVGPPDGLPTLRTVHDNGATCPSGSRYLKRTGTPCPRIASLPACLFGHYVDGCGSRRPGEVKRNFERWHANQRVVSTLPTITVSHFLKGQMAAQGYPMDTVEVLRSPAPDGSPAPPPFPADTAPRVLFVGRLVPEKGVDWLLRAARRLDEDIHIDIAGAGDHRSALEQQVQRLGLQHRVTFHGWVAASALHSLYRAAWVVVVPSVWHEPAGLVPLEAAAWGRPVVASEVGGLPEYADLSFSRLVPPNDDTRLADALAQLCAHPQEAAALGRAGHAHVRAHHALNQSLDEHEAIYSELSASTLSPSTRLAVSEN